MPEEDADTDPSVVLTRRVSSTMNNLHPSLRSHSKSPDMDGNKMIRCREAFGGRRFVADDMSQAEYWIKHGIKHSRIQMGSLSIPAYILPCSITIIFGLLKLYERYNTRIAKPRTNLASDEKSQNGNVREKAPDEENLADHVVGKEEDPKPASKFKIPIPVMAQFFYRMFTTQAIATISSQSTYQFPLTCALQSLSAICAGLFIDKTLLRPSISLALGWMALFLLHRFAEPFHLSLGSTAVALLAIFTQTWFLHSKKHAASLHAFQLNATLLAVICCDTLLTQHAWIRRVQILNQQLWPWAIMFLLGFTTEAVSVWRDTHSEKPLTISTLSSFAKQIFRVETTKFLPTLLGVVALLAEMVAVWCIAGYSTSCLNFRHLIMGMPATKPAVGSLSGIVGGLVAIWWFLLLLTARPSEIWRFDGAVGRGLLQARLGAEAVGSTVLVFTLLAAALTLTVNEPVAKDVRWTCESFVR